MNEYHKIQTLFKRDMENGGKKLLVGQWTKPAFEYLQGNVWEFTEKVDGTNIRIMWHGNGPVRFGGKTDNAQLPNKLVDRLRDMFPDNSLFMRKFGPDCPVCLYGEGYGAGIQKGGCYRQDQDFVLFDVKIGDWWLQRTDVEDVARGLELSVVPVIGHGTLLEAVEMASRGFDSMWGSFVAEGIVARPIVELKDRNGDRVITKVKYKDFN